MKSLYSLLILIVLSSCSGIDLQQYESNTPQLDLFEYFTGPTTGYGIVQNRSGELTRQFTVDIAGEVNDRGELVLTEDFDWSDGEKSQRIWILTRADQHSYSGTAEDVIGRADGIAYGNVLNWQYVVNLTVDDSTWKIHFDDWMFLVSEQLLINKAILTKFGFKVGEVTIVFQK
ncbi:DUF3833 domain-containing protein [Desulfosediminicola ganghwensis]|uniref:DUF3833 domain-containing protein n=1 Tax=Desulfosediminicola ganghwensis TaxID=2569540 RepID=UPI0010AB5480|nr:DUF3833 domain-containing protein [Desulfosediminicola ganghwensis]